MGYTKDDVLKAIRGSGGIVSMIQRGLGCASWDTALRYVNKWQETKDAYRTECQHTIDTARSVLLAAIRKGDVQSAKWYLERKARDEFAERPPEREERAQSDNEIRIIIDGA